jgi:hypothetical protein
MTSIIGFSLVLIALWLLDRRISKLVNQVEDLRQATLKSEARQNELWQFARDAVDNFALLHDDKSSVAGESFSSNILAVREAINESLRGDKGTD